MMLTTRKDTLIQVLKWIGCIAILVPKITLASVVQLTADNFDQVINGTDVVFVNFYADWCRFSQMLTPIYAEASDKFNNEPPGRVVWGTVDCDRNPDVAQRFQINKYPTLKMFRNGHIAKREYRGQRSVDGLTEHIRSQLNSPIIDFTNAGDLESKIDGGKRKVIAYFQTPQGPAFDNYKKIASNLREECRFYLGVGPEFQQETGQTGNKIVFRDSNMGAQDVVTFTGDAVNYAYMDEWITDKCIPLVREITFENAEELTEEGVPFLILFKKQDDQASLEVFRQEVARQLSDMKTSINCLHADGVKFAHPLHHLGKGEHDLPLLAIDSFRHMYLFPNYNDITQPNRLRQFILDLNSGKLHREFHHGPDPTEAPNQAELNNQDPNQPQAPAHAPVGSGGTDPPESVFKKLQPSHNRYTLLGKDEL